MTFSLICYFDQSLSDSMLQEGDYLVDLLVTFMVLAIAVYGGAKGHVKWVIMIVVCMKAAYWFDREESLNNKVDERFKRVKELVQGW